MDPSSIYGQAILQSKSGLGGAGNIGLILKMFVRIADGYNM